MESPDTVVVTPIGWAGKIVVVDGMLNVVRPHKDART
jgi:hypothetical protein